MVMMMVMMMVMVMVMVIKVAEDVSEDETKIFSNFHDMERMGVVFVILVLDILKPSNFTRLWEWRRGWCTACSSLSPLPFFPQQTQHR